MAVVNTHTLELIKHHEGLRLDAYPDVAHGWKVATIGYGHTNAMRPPEVRQGMTITARQAEEILLSDLQRTWDLMRPYIKVDLNENQKGALISFTFNLGIGNFSKSTLLKKLNNKDFGGAAAEFGKWINAGGKPYPGLIRRRAEEAQLFATPVGKTNNAPPASEPSKPRGATILDIIVAILKALFGK